MVKSFKLAYDGECFVCREVARNISLEFHAEPIPIQRIYDRYGLEHDAYLIIDEGIFIRGYSWILPYLLKYGLKRLLIRLIISGYGIERKYRLIRGFGRHPVKYMGRGKIPLKIFSLIASILFLSPLYKMWRILWRQSSSNIL